MRVETVFHYRTLVGKCELGVGLEWDEIEEVTSLEASFSLQGVEVQKDIGRRFRRKTVGLTALLRGDRINDRVDLVEIAPGGFQIRRAPYVARGELVEIFVDDGDVTYRFCARGVWQREDGEDYRVGLRLVGLPVCIHRVEVSASADDDVISRISAAA